MSVSHLVASDLDGTLVPMPGQKFDPMALAALKRALDTRSDFAVAFVSGRRLELVQQARQAFELPNPTVLIGDVGTSMWMHRRGQWRLFSKWHDFLAQSSSDDFFEQTAVLDAAPGFKLQPRDAQGDFKRSYFVNPLDKKKGLAFAQRKIRQLGLNARLVYSQDQNGARGLVDVLPAKGSKAFAIDFLRRHLGLSKSKVLVAGDSGNDLDSLTFGFKSVLVSNASSGVKKSVRAKAAQNGFSNRLWVAKKPLAAGVLEALVHWKWL